MKFRPGRRAPVAEQPRLDVLRLERLAQQRVVEQVDLADRQVVGRAPVGVDPAELVGRVGRRTGRLRCFGLRHGSSSAAGVPPVSLRPGRSTLDVERHGPLLGAFATRGNTGPDDQHRRIRQMQDGP